MRSLLTTTSSRSLQARTLVRCTRCRGSSRDLEKALELIPDHAAQPVRQPFPETTHHAPGIHESSHRVQHALRLAQRPSRLHFCRARVIPLGLSLSSRYTSLLTQTSDFAMKAARTRMGSKTACLQQCCSNL